MVDVKSDQDVPPRVMEMLRMFLAASSRGEEALFVLETRKNKMTTKFRIVETMAGAPANTSMNPIRKVNPARARRSKLRLEKFNLKKIEKKKQAETSPEVQTGDQKAGNQAAGETSSKLVLELSNERPVVSGSGLQSPILQLDGEALQGEEKVKYTFISNYGEEDIEDTLSDNFLKTNLATNATLVERVRTSPLSADHMCTVEFELTKPRDFSWPNMTACDADVFKEVKKFLQ